MNYSHKKKLLGLLARLYPNPHSELDFRGDYQLITAVILSAQCTDRKVNEISPLLFKRYPGFRKLGEADERELGAIIRPINYYRTKARNLIAMAREVQTRFDGRLPETHDELCSLPGVGRKTANVVRCERGHAALPVDTHVFRVARRLDLSQGKTPDAVEDDLRREFAPEHWYNLHHWLIWHGRRVCKAQRPLCADCPLARLCVFEQPAAEKASRRKKR